jgi:hypothetical protein
MSKIYTYLLSEANKQGHDAQALVVEAFLRAPLLWLPHKALWPRFKASHDQVRHFEMGLAPTILSAHIAA